MKLLKFLIALTINFIINYAIWIGLGFIVVLIYNTIMPKEILEVVTKRHLSIACDIGALVGIIWWITVKYINTLVYELFKKEKHSIRLTFDDGEDIRESSNSVKGKRQLD